MVTKITRSAASMSSTASSRLDRSTLSKSGASMITRPRSDVGVDTNVKLVATCQTWERAPWRTAGASSGWTSATGRRVVGRNKPDSDSRLPAMALKRLDFPTPVDPNSTTTNGAERSAARGRRYSETWRRSCSARSARVGSGAVSTRRCSAAPRSCKAWLNSTNSPEDRRLSSLRRESAPALPSPLGECACDDAGLR